MPLFSREKKVLTKGHSAPRLSTETAIVDLYYLQAVDMAITTIPPFPLIYMLSRVVTRIFSAVNVEIILSDMYFLRLWVWYDNGSQHTPVSLQSRQSSSSTHPVCIFLSFHYSINHICNSISIKFLSSSILFPWISFSPGVCVPVEQGK